MGCEFARCPRYQSIELARSANERLRNDGRRDGAVAAAKGAELDTEEGMIRDASTTCAGADEGFCGMEAIIRAAMQRTFTLPPAEMYPAQEAHHQVGFSSSAALARSDRNQVIKEE